MIARIPTIAARHPGLYLKVYLFERVVKNFVSGKEISTFKIKLFIPHLMISSIINGEYSTMKLQ